MFLSLQRPPNVYLRPPRGPGVSVNPCDTCDEDDSSCTTFEGDLREMDLTGAGSQSHTVSGETDFLQRDLRTNDSSSDFQALETPSTKQYAPVALVYCSLRIVVEDIGF